MTPDPAGETAEPLALIHLAQVDSTQDFLLRNPSLGFCGVLADSQSAGRGRGENVWLSGEPCGLWFSAALPQPDLPPGIVLQRAMAALLEHLEGLDLGLEPPLGLKWPNDLVARCPEGLRKLGGIIGEIRNGRMVLGLGLNLSRSPRLDGRALPAASLAELGARRLPERRALALALLERWRDLDRDFGPAFRWPAPGDAIRWEGGEGRCLGWEEDGRLRAQVSGRVEKICAGDIRGIC